MIGGSAEVLVARSGVCGEYIGWGATRQFTRLPGLPNPWLGLPDRVCYRGSRIGERRADNRRPDVLGYRPGQVFTREASKKAL